MSKSETYDWAVPPNNDRAIIAEGDVRCITLPVKARFTWADKIIVDYDTETGKVLEYRSGWVMDILPEQLVYYNEPTEFLYQTTIEDEKN